MKCLSPSEFSMMLILMSDGSKLLQTQLVHSQTLLLKLLRRSERKRTSMRRTEPGTM